MSQTPKEIEAEDTGRGRPPVETPPGWLTVAEAAHRRGVGYAVVYRMCKNRTIRSKQLESSKVILVDERDLDKIHKHEPPADRRRVPVQLSPNPDRYNAWAIVAGREDVTVTELGYRFLDDAALSTPDGIGCKEGDLAPFELELLRKAFQHGADVEPEHFHMVVRLLDEVERRRKLPPSMRKNF